MFVNDDFDSHTSTLHYFHHYQNNYRFRGNRTGLKDGNAYQKCHSSRINPIQLTQIHVFSLIARDVIY